MNKQKLVKKTAENLSITLKEAEEVLNGVVDAIEEGLVEDGLVSIVGFGKFLVRDKKPRKARNPQTGESIDVPAKKSPAFKPSAKLKNLVNL